MTPSVVMWSGRNVDGVGLRNDPDGRKVDGEEFGGAKPREAVGMERGMLESDMFCIHSLRISRLSSFFRNIRCEGLAVR